MIKFMEAGPNTMRYKKTSWLLETGGGGMRWRLPGDARISSIKTQTKGTAVVEMAR